MAHVSSSTTELAPDPQRPTLVPLPRADSLLRCEVRVEYLIVAGT